MQSYRKLKTDKVVVMDLDVTRALGMEGRRATAPPPITGPNLEKTTTISAGKFLSPSTRYVGINICPQPGRKIKSTCSKQAAVFSVREYAL